MGLPLDDNKFMTNGWNVGAEYELPPPPPDEPPPDAGASGSAGIAGGVSLSAIAILESPVRINTDNNTVTIFIKEFFTMLISLYCFFTQYPIHGSMDASVLLVLEGL